MVRSMRRNQTPNCVFIQIRIDSVKKFGEEVGMGRQTGECSLLPALVPCNGGIGVLFYRVSMADQQGKELLGPRFAIEGLHRGRV